MSEETTETTAPAGGGYGSGLRGKKMRVVRANAARDRCVDALATLNRYCEPHFDLGLLPRTDWPDEIWETRMAKVMRAVCAALQGTETTPFVEAESPEIQIEGLVKSQQSKSEYWQWTETELAKLTEYLEQHPGHVITPHYAHSCEVKTPEGRIYHYHRSGRLE